jgi:uncharacterized protein (TIGR04255 family)
MGKKYANPPVEEAVCEFRLTQDTQWDMTIPGLIYEKLRDEFSEREQRMISEMEFTHGAEGIQQHIRTSERVVLSTKDKKMLIQIGARLLVINVLKPYPSWQKYKPRVQKAWDSLLDTVEVKGIERMGLRYINLIKVPSPVSELSDFLQFYPFVGDKLPQRMVSFIMGAEFSFTDDRDRCRAQLAPLPATEGAQTFLLDIDYFLNRPRGVEVKNALEWVEEAHNRVEEIFEGCITDRLRKVFEEVPE